MAVQRDSESQNLHDLDLAPVNKFHRAVTVLSGMGVFLEGYDFTNIASALIFLVPYFKLNAAQISLLSVSTYIGTFIGAWSIGYLADRLGRKYMYMWDMVFYGLFALLSGLAINYTMLVVSRVGLGLAIGADQAISFTIIAEFAPSHARGRLNASTWVMWTVASLLTYAISYLLNPVFGQETWRVLFLLSILPVIIVIIGRHALPETPRWLMARGRTEEANRAVAMAIGTASQHATPVGAQVVQTSPTRRFARFGDLFRTADQTRRTLYIVFMWFCITVNTYGIGYFTPFIFKTLGFTAANSLLGGMIVAVFAVVGSVIMYLSVDRIGRKTLAVLGFGLLAVVDFVIALIAHSLVFDVLVVLFSVFQLAAWIGPAGLVGVVAPEVFPTEIRSLGTGFAAAMGRLGSIVGILILPFLLKSVGLQGTMFVFFADAFIAFIAMLVFGRETKGKSLEALFDDRAKTSPSPNVGMQEVGQ
ncbi:MAG TPA: MFS transporter [Ktedonobacteraceae bacterium]|nr:MFS transporter [Ktedonobacteraceae bacterium]